MRKKILVLSLLFVSLLGFSQTENSEHISLALKTGNAKEISKYFNATINLKIINQESVYSRTQAEIILKDFFIKYPPKSYISKHNGSSKNGAQYTIGQLSTTNGNFRTYYFVKKIENSFLIQEFRIESE